MSWRRLRAGSKSFTPPDIGYWCAGYGPLHEWALGTRTAEDLQENNACDDYLTPIELPSWPATLIIGFVALGLATIIYHFGWNGCAKPRWQDRVFNAQKFLHESDHPPPAKQIVYTLIWAVLGTVCGAFLYHYRYRECPTVGQDPLAVWCEVNYPGTCPTGPDGEPVQTIAVCRYNTSHGAGLALIIIGAVSIFTRLVVLKT